MRRINLLPPFTEPHKTAFGALYDSGDYAAGLDLVLEAAGYADLRREQAERRANLAERRDEVAALGFDDRFWRMWDLYLCYCEAAFMARSRVKAIGSRISHQYHCWV